MRYIMPIRFFFAFFLFFTLHHSVWSRNLLDTTFRPTTTNSLINSTRTTRIEMVKDSVAKQPIIKSAVKYSAEDSIKLDTEHTCIYLYGKAKVKYEDFELIADYIRFDKKNNTLFAKGLLVKNNDYHGRPIFESGKDAPMTADSLAYNFTSKKGKSYGTISEQDGGFIQAQQFKKGEEQEGYFKNGIYTTCNDPHPHFGIRITKGIVSDKKIVTGPAYIEIEDVPFPIFLPFGFFPKPNKRSSGILFPAFGEDPSRGFFLRDLGFYIGFSDFWDMKILTTVFSKGNFNGNLQGQYLKRYRYSGNLSFDYAYTQSGLENSVSANSQKDFRFTWAHTKNANSTPGTSFAANVNIASSSYLSRTAAGFSYNFSQITTNNLSSSISYGKTWRNTPFNFTSSLSHRQDITQKTISLYLPNFSFNVATINPFDLKKNAIVQKWYQRLTIGYSLQGQNTVENIKESELFSQQTLQQFKTGVSHTVPIELSLNVFKYFQFNSGINYNEKWYLKTIRKTYNVQTNAVENNTVDEFSRFYEYDLTTGFSTKLYGSTQFRKGKIKAIRHVLTPRINFNYRPDFSDSWYGFYRYYTDANGLQQKYSIFENGIYGSPSAGKTAGISFSIENNVDAKIKTKNSAGEEELKKIPILQGLALSGSYNFLADSLKLSPISFNGRTNLLGEKFGINFNGTFDPYQLNPITGTRINKLELKNGNIARLTAFNFSFGFNLNADALKKKKEKLENNKLTPLQTEQLAAISTNPNAFVDFTIPWNLTINYSLNYSKPNISPSSINNTLNFNGDVNVTQKWKIGFQSGYDFKTEKLSATSLSIYRDLHCWDLSFQWIPFGAYQSYNVNLKVKATILSDLKLTKRRDFFN